MAKEPKKRLLLKPIQKELASGLNINLSDPNDPFRRILEEVVEAYATEFKDPKYAEVGLKPSGKLAHGLIDRFARLNNIGLPYGVENPNRSLSMHSVLDIYKDLGLVKEGTPLKVGKKSIPTNDLSPKFFDIVKKVQKGKLPGEALEDSIPLLISPTKVEPTAIKSLSQEAIEHLERRGKKVPKSLSDVETLITELSEEKDKTYTRRELFEKMKERSVQISQEGRERSRSKSRKKAAETPLLGATRKKIEAYMKSRGLKKSIVPYLVPTMIGGGLGLLFKTGEAAAFAAEATPVGRSPENLSLEQSRQMLNLAQKYSDQNGRINWGAAIKGGDPGAEEFFGYVTESPYNSIPHWQDLVARKTEESERQKEPETRRVTAETTALFPEDKNSAMQQQMQKLLQQ